MTKIKHWPLIVHGDLFNINNAQEPREDKNYDNTYWCDKCLDFHYENHFLEHKNRLADFIIYERTLAHKDWRLNNQQYNMNKVYFETPNLFKDKKRIEVKSIFIEKLLGYLLNKNLDDLSRRLKAFSVSLLEDINFDTSNIDYQYIKYYILSDKMRSMQHIYNMTNALEYNFEKIYDLIVEVLHGEEYCFKNNLYSFKKSHEEQLLINKKLKEERSSLRDKRRESISLKDRILVFERDNYTCRKCKRSSQIDGVKLNVDHIIPVAKGGKNEMSNYQTLCFDCNAGKSDMILSCALTI